MSKLREFAHLLGIGSVRASADDTEENAESQDFLDENPDDEENAEDDEKDTKARKAKGRRADKDKDEEPEAEDDEKDTKARKAKGSRRAEDEENDPEAEESDKDEKAKAVQADRSRCAQIMAFGLKNGCAHQAFVMAFDSNMSVRSAKVALGVGGKSAAANFAPGGASNAGLSQRMASLQTPKVSNTAAAELPEGMSPLAAQIIAAGKNR